MRRPTKLRENLEGLIPLLPLVGLIALALVGTGCQFTHLADRPWIEVESENFRISSTMGAEESEELLRELELFRAGVLAMTRAPAQDSAVPTRILVFDRPSAFRPFSPGRNVAGYFVPNMRANFVAALDSRGGLDSLRVMKHEYVHFLVRNGTRRVYPRWFDEGFAELLSTAKVSGPHFVVGSVPTDRLMQLRTTPWLSLRHVLSYDGSEAWPPRSVAMFYAEAWGLLHYLTRDLDHAVKLASRLEIYLDQIEGGADVERAVLVAFGMSVDELDKAVKRHLRAGSFQPMGVREDRLSWNDETTTRTLRRSEASQRLGELSLMTGKTKLAEAFFRVAIEDDPGMATAHAGLGDVQTSRNEWEPARASFARAVELEPENPLNQLDFGEYWMKRAEGTEDLTEKSALLDKARVYLERALDLDEWKPEAWAMIGATYLQGGHDPEKAVEHLEIAHRRLPSSGQIQLLLAEAYVASETPSRARPLLTRLVAWGHGGGGSEKAAALLGELEATETQATPHSPAHRK